MYDKKYQLKNRNHIKEKKVVSPFLSYLLDIAQQVHLHKLISFHNSYFCRLFSLATSRSSCLQVFCKKRFSENLWKFFRKAHVAESYCFLHIFLLRFSFTITDDLHDSKRWKGKIFTSL